MSGTGFNLGGVSWGDAGNWINNLFGSGQGVGAGAAAPGMTDAGYTLAPGLTQAASDPAAGAGGIANKDVSAALKSLGGAGGAAAGAGKGAGAVGGPALGGGGAGIGRGGGVSLTPLLQLLAQRREALMNSATSGVGMGQSQPQGAGRVQGLLGF